MMYNYKSISIYQYKSMDEYEYNETVKKTKLKVHAVLVHSVYSRLECA